MKMQWLSTHFQEGIFPFCIESLTDIFDGHAAQRRLCMFCGKLLRLLTLVVLIYRGIGDVAVITTAFLPGGTSASQGTHTRSSHRCLCKSCRSGMKCCCQHAQTPIEATAMIATCDNPTDAALRILHFIPLLLPVCGSLPLSPNFSCPLLRNAIIPPGHTPSPPDQPPRFL